MTGDLFNSRSLGWDRQEVYVLNTLKRLDETVSGTQEEVQEIKELLVGLNAKFDKYNNFNERLFQHGEEIQRLKTEGAVNKLKVAGIITGVGFVVSLVFNILAAVVSKFWTGAASG